MTKTLTVSLDCTGIEEADDGNTSYYGGTYLLNGKECRGRGNDRSDSFIDDIQDAKYAIDRGDIVTFNPKKRNYPTTIEGKVTAINQKTVTVQPINGGRPWRVQADLVVKKPTAAG